MSNTEIDSIPWAMLAPHDMRAERNHSQNLAKLASRGGLDASEAMCILLDVGWGDYEGTKDDATRDLSALVKKFTTARRRNGEETG